MKYRALTLVIALVMTASLSAQTSPTAKNLPPGWVDGSKTPNLIPDRVAYRLVFYEADAARLTGRNHDRAARSPSDTNWSIGR